MSKIILYTILYPFMSSDLGLFGYDKEVFAVIFNFWLHSGEKPVRASLSTIQKIIGGSRPTILRAVNALIEGQLISPDKHPGRPTMYSVTIPSEILTEFKNTYRKKQVQSVNQQEFSYKTTTSAAAKPQKYTKGKCNNTTLRVGKKEEVITGGLPEAK